MQPSVREELYALREMAAVRKIKAEQNGDIIISTELARLAGVMPNMEAHVVIKDEGKIELISEDAELKQDATIQEMLDILGNRGEIKLYKCSNPEDFPAPTQEEINEFEESVRWRIIPLEEMIQQEREERDEAIRL